MPEREAGPARPLVLAVDDEPINLELIEGYLTTVDCDLAKATSGREALALAARRPPSLVLLDVRMPGIDGLEVCRRLKADPETRLTPVVMVTALSETADRVRAMEAGADDFLVKPVERTELVARVRSLIRTKALLDGLDDTQRVIVAMARAVEAKDSYTEAHTERVATSAVLVGQRSGLAQADLDVLYFGGLVHDIGKIGVPDAILLKPGPLDPEEWKLMQRHTLIGEEIARPLRSMAGCLRIIRNHHERADGQGYPDRLQGDAIPLLARIVAISDAYDAMTTARPYRPARSPAESLAILEAGAGSQWDAELVRIFIDEMRRSLGQPAARSRGASRARGPGRPLGKRPARRRTAAARR